MQEHRQQLLAISVLKSSGMDSHGLLRQPDKMDQGVQLPETNLMTGKAHLRNEECDVGNAEGKWVRSRSRHMPNWTC